MLLGAAVDGVLKGLAAGVVPVTHATLILLPGRAHHAVTAHFLLVERHGRLREKHTHHHAHTRTVEPDAYTHSPTCTRTHISVHEYAHTQT